jgi:hypothetical protein
MPDVLVVPGAIEAAATDVSAVGSTLNAAHLSAAIPTSAVIPAAADEVSTSIANLFSQHAANYQALAGKAETYLGQFVQHLKTSASSFSAAEAANGASLLHSSASAAAASPFDALTSELTTLGSILAALPNIFVGIGVLGVDSLYLFAAFSYLALTFGILVLRLLLQLAFNISIPLATLPPLPLMF